MQIITFETTLHLVRTDLEVDHQIGQVGEFLSAQQVDLATQVLRAEGFHILTSRSGTEQSIIFAPPGNTLYFDLDHLAALAEISIDLRR